MSQQDVFERILALLHDAALDDVHWSEAARLINEAGQTKSNALAFSDRRQQPRPDGAESGTGHAHGAPRRWSNPMSESTARG